jgi:oligoendopeptidase F
MEDYFSCLWHRQGHLFSQPFYYIEYAIAQIGALQAWVQERKDHEGTVAAYREALALGGSKGLKDLFESAGLRFAMGKEILSEIIPAVMARIEELDIVDAPGDEAGSTFKSISSPHPDLDSQG